MQKFERMQRIAQNADRWFTDSSSIDIHLNVKAADVAREVGRAHLWHDLRRSYDHAGKADQFVDV